MIRVLDAAAALFLLFALSGCGGSDTGLPTGPGPIRSGGEAAPPPPTAPPPAGQPASPVTGMITLVGVSPDLGQSLTVAPCGTGGAPRECAAGWSGTFEVAVSAVVQHPVLTISFYDKSRLCGYAGYGGDTVLPAGTTVFHLKTIYLTDEFGSLSPPCALPATATRMVAELWSDADGTSMKQEFPIAYIFVKP